MESRRAWTYSEVERGAALARVREAGLARAAKELGIPKGTLGFWAYRKRQRSGAESRESSGGGLAPGGDGSGGGMPCAAAPLTTAFESAVARHGRPDAVMHDGGSAFWSWKDASRFTRLLEEYGVDQIKADVPQLNGKSEVFNANIQKELFEQVIFAEVGELRCRLGPHFHWYDHQRTHHARGGLLVPADRFFGRVDEVMARIEAGGVGVADPADLGLRTLDLFRVTSRNGKPEVWMVSCLRGTRPVARSISKVAQNDAAARGR